MPFMQAFECIVAIVVLSTPKLIHGYRTRRIRNVCRQLGTPPGVSYLSMVFNPLYWHLWTVSQWKRHFDKHARW